MLFFDVVGNCHFSANPRVAQRDGMVGCAGGKLLVNAKLPVGFDEATGFAEHGRGKLFIVRSIYKYLEDWSDSR